MLYVLRKETREREGETQVSRKRVLVGLGWQRCLVARYNIIVVAITRLGWVGTGGAHDRRASEWTCLGVVRLGTNLLTLHPNYATPRGAF